MTHRCPTDSQSTDKYASSSGDESGEVLGRSPRPDPPLYIYKEEKEELRKIERIESKKAPDTKKEKKKRQGRTTYGTQKNI